MLKLIPPTGNLNEIEPGKYLIDGDKLFAIVQEYDTLDPAMEKMESHRKYIDVQYMIQGEELVGHALLAGQEVCKEYNDAEDFMLYTAYPDFFTRMSAGTFVIFFPSDLHMPCIKTEDVGRVKKVVVKVAVD